MERNNRTNPYKDAVLIGLFLSAAVWWCGIHRADEALAETRFQVAREHGWDINQLTKRQNAIVESEARDQLQSDNDPDTVGNDDHASGL